MPSHAHKSQETRDATDVEPISHEPSSVPALVVVFAGGLPAATVIPLAANSGRLELGRGHPALAAYRDHHISQRHLAVAFDGRELTVTDLGSTNGTSVDGNAIRPAMPYEAQRTIRIGHTLLMPVQDAGPLVRDGVGFEAGRVEGPAFREALRVAAHMASSSRTLCIVGEKGAGKETLARAFHAASGAGGSFRVVRCGAIPKSTLDALLWGTTSGAEGYVRSVDGGTLLIEGVAELPRAVQSRLIHVLESGEVFPVGAEQPVKVDVRICFTVPRDLRHDVEDGRLCEDLYWRITAPRIVLPPLRERREEIPWLVQTEVKRAARGLVVHPSLVEACLLRPWPGNVEELLVEVRAAVRAALADGAPRVDARHLGPFAGTPLSALPSSKAGRASEPSSASSSSAEMKALISTALAHCEGNVSAASRELGVHRTQLRRWLDRYRIDARSFVPPSSVDEP